MQKYIYLFFFVEFADDTEIVIDYDYSDIDSTDLKRAKVLFATIGEVMGRSTRATISLKSNFYELGGNSLNSIYTVAKLREKGYFIEISEFISAKNLQEMMAHLNEVNSKQECAVDEEFNFRAFPLAMEHKADTIKYKIIFIIIIMNFN